MLPPSYSEKLVCDAVRRAGEIPVRDAARVAERFREIAALLPDSRPGSARPLLLEAAAIALNALFRVAAEPATEDEP